MNTTKNLFDISHKLSRCIHEKGLEELFFFDFSGQILHVSDANLSCLPWLKGSLPCHILDIFPNHGVRQKMEESFGSLAEERQRHGRFSWSGGADSRRYAVRWYAVGEGKGVLLIQDISSSLWVNQGLYALAEILQIARGGVALTDIHGTILSVNPAFSDITGYSPKEVEGQNPRILKSDHHPKEFYEEMWKKLLDKGHWEGEIWNRKKSGEAYPEYLKISAIKDDSGQICRYVSVFYDLSELKSVQKEIAHHKEHHKITSLPHRFLFMDRLALAISRKKKNSPGRIQGNIAVVYIGLDRFKTVNNRYGYVLGDKVLARVAHLLSDLAPKGNVGYMGGDEYALFFSDLPVKTSLMREVSKILDKLQAPMAWGEKVVRLGGSVGVSVFPGDASSAEEMVHNAETAMYQAKKQGGSQSAFSSREMHLQVFRKANLEAALRRGLEEDEFFLDYQPKVDLETGKILGVEGLIRWLPKGERKPVSPAEFIPLAEESGLIIPLGEWVVRRVCADMVAWDNMAGPPIVFAANVSATQFYKANFHEILSLILGETGADPSRLILEITENTMLGEPENLQCLLQGIIGLGVSLSVDDFGTGYSSLGYLRYLPLKELKVDKVFVDSLESEPRAGDLLRSIVFLGRSLGLAIVVEGVERETQRQFLKGFGVPLAIQGFLCARPTSLEEVKSLWVRE